MTTIFANFVAEHFAGALLFFPIVWILMRKKDGKRLNVSSLSLIAGLFATAALAGTIRFMAIYVIGGKAALNPAGGLATFFFLGLPILVSIGVSACLRAKAVSVLPRQGCASKAR